MMRGATLIIAEAGVNHNGSIETAGQLIETAAEAGADLVKFQTFSADRLVTGSASKAGYQLETTSTSESQHEMIRKLELSRETHVELISHCHFLGPLLAQRCIRKPRLRSWRNACSESVHLVTVKTRNGM